MIFFMMAYSFPLNICAEHRRIRSFHTDALGIMHSVMNLGFSALGTFCILSLLSTYVNTFL